MQNYLRYSDFARFTQSSHHTFSYHNLKEKKNPGFVKFNIIFQSFANAQLSMMEFIHFAVIQPTGNMS